VTRRADPRRHAYLHQILGRRTGGLHDEHIAATHVLHQLNEHFTVAESPHIRASHGNVQMPGDLLRKSGIRLAGEHGDR
jgi:hypothetical protein